MLILTGAGLMFFAPTSRMEVLACGGLSELLPPLRWGVELSSLIQTTSPRQSAALRPPWLTSPRLARMESASVFPSEAMVAALRGLSLQLLYSP